MAAPPASGESRANILPEEPFVRNGAEGETPTRPPDERRQQVGAGATGRPAPERAPVRSWDERHSFAGSSVGPRSSTALEEWEEAVASGGAEGIGNRRTLNEIAASWGNVESESMKVGSVWESTLTQSASLLVKNTG